MNLKELSISKLLRLANRLSRHPETSNAKAGSRKIKLAVLGSYSVQHLCGVLRLFLDNEGFEVELYEGEYDGINMDVLDDTSALYSFKPDFVAVLMRHSDFHFENGLDGELSYFQNIWQHLSRIDGVTIIQSNIALPIERPYGTLEAQYASSRLSLLRQLNVSISASHPPNVHILDMEYLSSYYGKAQWFDEASYFLTKQGFSMDYIGVVSSEITRIILSIAAKTNKCLVLDLDNTIWGGVVGDDGPMGIDVDPHDPLGEAYRAFQSYVLSLKERGVILAVNSKNDEDIAKEPFLKNPDMVLKLDDIACFCANWDDKASNMAFIAKSLNIGIDTLVFFDDNPAEREIVRKFCPSVTVIEVPAEPENYVRALDQAGVFDWAAITDEDKVRSSSYVENAKRAKLSESFVDYEDYLRALEMKMSSGVIGENEIGRFTQLTNKSNQFNLRTNRYSESVIRSMMEDKNVRCIYVSLSDKFTTYGIISCIILRTAADDAALRDDDCFIENWCMSCRVLRRGVEEFAFEQVKQRARELGCRRIVGEYIRTKKNGMVEGLYAKLGFKAMNVFGRIMYEYELSE